MLSYDNTNGSKERPDFCDPNLPWLPITFDQWIRPVIPNCIPALIEVDPPYVVPPVIDIDIPDPNWYDCFCAGFTFEPGDNNKQAACGEEVPLENILGFDVENLGDCCNPDYKYTYNLTLPCDLNGITAMTKQWYKEEWLCSSLQGDNGLCADSLDCKDCFNKHCNPDYYKLFEHGLPDSKVLVESFSGYIPVDVENDSTLDIYYNPSEVVAGTDIPSDPLKVYEAAINFTREQPKSEYGTTAGLAEFEYNELQEDKDLNTVPLAILKVWPEDGYWTPAEEVDVIALVWSKFDLTDDGTGSATAAWLKYTEFTFTVAPVLDLEIDGIPLGNYSSVELLIQAINTSQLGFARLQEWTGTHNIIRVYTRDGVEVTTSGATTVDNLPWSKSTVEIKFKDTDTLGNTSADNNVKMATNANITVPEVKRVSDTDNYYLIHTTIGTSDKPCCAHHYRRDLELNISINLLGDTGVKFDFNFLNFFIKNFVDTGLCDHKNIAYGTTNYSATQDFSYNRRPLGPIKILKSTPRGTLVNSNFEDDTVNLAAAASPWITIEADRQIDTITLKSAEFISYTSSSSLCNAATVDLTEGSPPIYSLGTLKWNKDHTKVSFIGPTSSVRVGGDCPKDRFDHDCSGGFYEQPKPNGPYTLVLEVRGHDGTHVYETITYTWERKYNVEGACVGLGYVFMDIYRTTSYVIATTNPVTSAYEEEHTTPVVFTYPEDGDAVNMFNPLAICVVDKFATDPLDTLTVNLIETLETDDIDLSAPSLELLEDSFYYTSKPLDLKMALAVEPPIADIEDVITKILSMLTGLYTTSYSSVKFELTTLPAATDTSGRSIENLTREGEGTLVYTAVDGSDRVYTLTCTKGAFLPGDRVRVNYPDRLPFPVGSIVKNTDNQSWATVTSIPRSSGMSEYGYTDFVGGTDDPTRQGTVTSVSGFTITDNTASWSINEWIGKYVRDYVGNVATIISNTATAITYATTPAMVFSTSAGMDEYTILDSETPINIIKPGIKYRWEVITQMDLDTNTTDTLTDIWTNTDSYETNLTYDEESGLIPIQSGYPARFTFMGVNYWLPFMDTYRTVKGGDEDLLTVINQDAVTATVNTALDLDTIEGPSLSALIPKTLDAYNLNVVFPTYSESRALFYNYGNSGIAARAEDTILLTSAIGNRVTAYSYITYQYGFFLPSSDNTTIESKSKNLNVYAATLGAATYLDTFANNYKVIDYLKLIEAYASIERPGSADILDLTIEATQEWTTRDFIADSYAGKTIEGGAFRGVIDTHETYIKDDGTSTKIITFNCASVDNLPTAKPCVIKELDIFGEVASINLPTYKDCYVRKSLDVLIPTGEEVTYQLSFDGTVELKIGAATVAGLENNLIGLDLVLENDNPAVPTYLPKCQYLGKKTHEFARDEVTGAPKVDEHGEWLETPVDTEDTIILRPLSSRFLYDLENAEIITLHFDIMGKILSDEDNTLVVNNRTMVVNGNPKSLWDWADSSGNYSIIDKIDQDCIYITKNLQELDEPLSSEDDDVDNMYFADCGQTIDCEKNLIIDKDKFSCKFGLRVQGDSVNSTGCGGGGMTMNTWLSCPHNPKIPCKKPTAPCGCIFVIDYLLVIPLGSVLL